MLTGVASFLAVLLNLVATGNAKAASLLAAVILWSDGFQAVQEVENRLDSDAAVED
jgi:hypothetical protein